MNINELKGSLPALLGQAVDIVEDFFESQHIFIPNNDRAEVLWEEHKLYDNWDNAMAYGLALIYGFDYDAIANPLETRVREKIENHPRVFFANEEISEIGNEILEAALVLIPDNKVKYDCKEKLKTRIQKELKDLLECWSLSLDSAYRPKFATPASSTIVLDDIFEAELCVAYAKEHHMAVLFTETKSCSSVEVLMMFQKAGFQINLQEVERFAPDGVELDPAIHCLFTRGE